MGFLSYSARWNRFHLCLYWEQKKKQRVWMRSSWISAVGWMWTVQRLYSEFPLPLCFIPIIPLPFSFPLSSHWRLLGFFSSWFMFQLKAKRMSHIAHKRWYHRSCFNCCNWDLIIFVILLSSAAQTLTGFTQAGSVLSSPMMPCSVIHIWQN